MMGTTVNTTTAIAKRNKGVKWFTVTMMSAHMDSGFVQVICTSRKLLEQRNGIDPIVTRD